MPDETLLARLELLDQYIRDVRESLPRSFQEYQADKMRRRYTERMLHLAIDTCIQTGIGLLTREGLRSPENYHDVFIILGEAQILPRPLGDAMTALVEFRNLLVYDHASVEDTMVYGYAKKRLNDLANFSNVVREYVERRGGRFD